MRFGNDGLHGEPKGYSAIPITTPSFLWIFSGRTIWLITIDPITPFYFEDSKHRKLHGKGTYKCDGASIPWPFDRFWSPTKLFKAGSIHDFGCDNEGLYMIMPDGTEVFLPMTRKELDALMEEMSCTECKEEGNGIVYRWITEHCIYAGVRLGAWFGMGKPEKKHKLPTSLDDNKPKPTIK